MFFPEKEVHAAFLRLQKDHEMSAALSVLEFFEKNYLRTRYNLKGWNHHDSLMALLNVTTNDAETFNGAINKAMTAGMQFYKIVYLIEMCLADVERSRERYDHGNGISDMGNNTRFAATLRANRNLRHYSKTCKDDDIELRINTIANRQKKFMTFVDHHLNHTETCEEMEKFLQERKQMNAAAAATQADVSQADVSQDVSIN